MQERKIYSELIEFKYEKIGANKYYLKQQKFLEEILNYICNVVSNTSPRIIIKKRYKIS